MNEKTLLCGIDEAGRGPLAGPVCAGAVILSENFSADILDDSKNLKPSVREELRALICRGALAWGIGWASAAEIDAVNIHNASLLSMKRAFEAMNAALAERPEFTAGMPPEMRAVADGLFVPDISIPCQAVVKADTKVSEVMAASILAKTARDRLMDYYALFYPQYGYEKHRGYPTKAHHEAILRYGPSPIQRMSFSVSLLQHVSLAGRDHL